MTSRLALQISCAHNLSAMLGGIPPHAAFKAAWEALADCDDDCLQAISIYFTKAWGSEGVRIQLENLVNDLRDEILDARDGAPMDCGVSCLQCTAGGLCEYSTAR